MPLTQWAAVIARSPAGLSTTLAVQKCLRSWPPATVNRAPTAGVPLKDRAAVSVGGAAGPWNGGEPTASAIRAARRTAPPAGVITTMAQMMAIAALTTQIVWPASVRARRACLPRPRLPGQPGRIHPPARTLVRPGRMILPHPIVYAKAALGHRGISEVCEHWSASGRRAGTRKVRPGLPTGYPGVGSLTAPGGHGGVPPGRGSPARAREQRLVAGRRDVFVPAAK